MAAVRTAPNVLNIPQIQSKLHIAQALEKTGEYKEALTYYNTVMAQLSDNPAGYEEAIATVITDISRCERLLNFSATPSGAAATALPTESKEKARDVSIAYSSLFPVGPCLLPEPNAEEDDLNCKKFVKRARTFCTDLRQPEKVQRQQELERCCRWLQQVVPICDHQGNEIFLYNDYQGKVRRLKWEILVDNPSACFISLGAPRIGSYTQSLGTEAGLFARGKQYQVLEPIYDRLRRLGIATCIEHRSKTNIVLITNELFLKQLVDYSLEHDHYTEFKAPDLARTLEHYLKSGVVSMPADTAKLCADYISPDRTVTDDRDFALAPYKDFGDEITPLHRPKQNRCVLS